MDRIQELLGNITNLSDDELNELKDLILQQFDAQGSGDSDNDGDTDAAPTDGDTPAPTGAMSAARAETLQELADAAKAFKAEKDRRDQLASAITENAELLNGLRGGEEMAGQAAGGGTTAPAQGGAPAPGKKKQQGASGGSPAPQQSGGGGVAPPNAAGSNPGSNFSGGGEGDGGGAGTGTAQPEAPEGHEPVVHREPTTVVTAGADVPGWALGAQVKSWDDMASMMAKRIASMRGLRGGDGDKLIVASAELQMPENLTLKTNDAEGNLAKVQAFTSPQAVVAAGGLAAPEESKYDLFGVGVADRPVRSSLPVFSTERGGVRFMRPPTLNDLDGAIGIWTVANDIAAATDSSIRKPAFRVNHGPEIVVDTQAITMILTFGNMVSRAYPELVARHNELALIAQARVAEQQLLTQIGALSTQITGREQQLSSLREILLQVSMAAAAYKNRHRTGDTPIKCIMPMWFLELLRADIMLGQHLTPDQYALADNQIEQFFTARKIDVTWAMDGEAGQDYGALQSGALVGFPERVIWYMYVEGTFSFMDNGTLDLGLVRDSTLNSANDYQMFVETFENAVKFGSESLRVSSTLKPFGAGQADINVVNANDVASVLGDMPTMQQPALGQLA